MSRADAGCQCQMKLLFTPSAKHPGSILTHLPQSRLRSIPEVLIIHTLAPQELLWTPKQTD
jgi:hypothetical protein